MNERGLTKMPQVKWMESNEMYWEDRYVKDCWWQLLLLPRWLVPNDRSVEKGAFDNRATIKSTRSLFPSVYLYWRFCIVVGTDLKSKRLGLFYRLACEMHFVSFCGLWIAVWIKCIFNFWRIGLTQGKKAQTQKPHFLFFSLAHC